MGSKYKCVNCGEDVVELYKKYSPTVLKLTQCEVCQEVADKYIEFDPVIVMIDLVLLRKEAYRHVLFNTPFEGHWKLSVVVLLTEACCEWSSLSQTGDTQPPEYGFYSVCCQEFFGSAALVSVMLLLTALHWKLVPRPAAWRWASLGRALALAGAARLLLLPALVWALPQTHRLFVDACAALALAQAYRVVTQAALWETLVAVALAVGAKSATRLLARNAAIG